MWYRVKWTGGQRAGHRCKVVARPQRRIRAGSHDVGSFPQDTCDERYRKRKKRTHRAASQPKNKTLRPDRLSVASNRPVHAANKVQAYTATVDSRPLSGVVSNTGESSASARRGKPDSPPSRHLAGQTTGVRPAPKVGAYLRDCASHRKGEGTGPSCPRVPCVPRGLTFLASLAGPSR